MDYFDINADYSVNEFYEQMEKLRKDLKKYEMSVLRLYRKQGN